MCLPHPASSTRTQSCRMSSQQAIDHPLQLGARDIEGTWGTPHLRGIGCIAQHDAASTPDCIMEVTPPHSLGYAAICVRV
jgi:hypothetical protein